MKLAWLLALAGAIQLCAGSKILAIVQMPSRSHHNLLERLVIELTKKGHEVTLITPYKQSKPVKNLKEIIIPDLYKNLTALMQPEKKDEESNMFEMRHMPKWLSLFIFPKMGPMYIDLLLSTPQLQQLINSNQNYDLVIGEVFLSESLLGGLSAKFKAPIIGLAPFMPNGWVNFWVGNPAPASYIPEPLLGFSPRMTFLQRVENTLFGLVGDIMYRCSYINEQDKVMRKYFGDDLPHLETIIKNTSLILVNHHFSLGFPRPYLPNMVEIGGYHINPPKPLPADLQKYFDESKDGVVYFSMGSHLKSAQLPNEKKQEILKAFSRLKQDVLWKFEDDTLKDVPKNVKILKWVPQSDVLAHPNLKLFITHGGLLSTTEAVTRGVPLIGIPVMGDQPLNMKYTTNAGFGLTLDFDDVTEDALYNAITEILNNPKYKENIKRGSVLIQDIPMTAMDTALYWIDYVLRHKGAPHLRSAAQDLKWHELYLLDVIGVLLIGSLTVVLVNFYVARLIFRRIFGKKSAKVSSKKKEN